MSILKIQTARVFEPLLAPARYKAAFGGRGSGKSHFFGELLVETCQAERGTLAVCIREAQRTLAQSSKRLIESKIAALGLGHGFRVFNDKIETPGDGLIIFRGMQDHTADSIKSLEGFRIAWVDEAQSLSPRSLALLRPTIRAKKLRIVGIVESVQYPARRRPGLLGIDHADRVKSPCVSFGASDFTHHLRRVIRTGRNDLWSRRRLDDVQPSRQERTGVRGNRRYGWNVRISAYYKLFWPSSPRGGGRGGKPYVDGWRNSGTHPP